MAISHTIGTCIQSIQYRQLGLTHGWPPPAGRTTAGLLFFPMNTEQPPRSVTASQQGQRCRSYLSTTILSAAIVKPLPPKARVALLFCHIWYMLPLQKKRCFVVDDGMLVLVVVAVTGDADHVYAPV